MDRRHPFAAPNPPSLLQQHHHHDSRSHQQQQQLHHPPPLVHQPHTFPPATGARHHSQPPPPLRHEVDRDRPFSASASAPKRLKMSNHSRTTSRDEYRDYRDFKYPQQHPSHPQQSPHPPPMPPHSQLPPAGPAPQQRHYGEPLRSPDRERSNGPGSAYRVPQPPLQHQRHDSLSSNGPINPSSSRGSPYPPHRTSTPDSHSHRRTPSFHNSPQLSRDPVMQPQPPSQHQPPQHQQNIRGMPPPSSPHRVHPPSQPLRLPPTSSLHQPSGPQPPSFGQAPPGGPARDLPALSSLPTVHRPSMSISSMLDSAPSVSPQTAHPSPAPSHSLPPLNPPSSRPPDLSPLKGPFNPDFGAPLDRKDVGSTSASPSSGSASLSGLAGTKTDRATPDHHFRPHPQLQHPSGTPNQETEASLGPPMYGHRGPAPPRPLSQPSHPGHSLQGMHDDGQSRLPMRSSSFSERGRMQERERVYEREQRYYDAKQQQQREREMSYVQERAYREEQDSRVRQREREREREQRERDRMERERAERERKRERDEDLERKERERFMERDRFGPSVSNAPMFGRQRMELQPPAQGPGAHPPYPTARYGSETHSNGVSKSAAASAPPMAATSSMSLPQGSVPGAGGLGPTPPPLPNASRDGFPPFSGYNVAMPSSPFGHNTSLPALPNVSDDARDRDGRPQRYKPARDILALSGASGGREEPLRAEDALQRGLNRSLSSLIEDDKKRNVGKDRDGIVKDKDGFMRLTDSAIVHQSPPPRRSAGLGFGAIGRDWGESMLEKDKDGKEKLGLGIMALNKRDREDEEGSVTKAEKKKTRHHHHHQHHHLSHHHHHHEEGSPGTLDEPLLLSARSKSPLHPPHRHTLIHHHHAQGTSHPGVQAPVSKLTTTLLIDSSKVLAAITSQPRNYLGSMVYLPSPTPKPGSSITHPLIPRFEGKENSIFQIRIPKRFLGTGQRRDVCRRRCVWGTEVYTDDSDVLGVLIHTGRIPGVLPGGVDPFLTKETGRKIVVRGALSAAEPPSAKWKGSEAAAKDDKNVPSIPPGKDLIVDLLILPTLERYSGTTRNGFKSRSWKTVHDGVSYAIFEMDWVPAGEAESRGGRNKKRRLDEREWVRKWGELPPSLGGMGKMGGWAKGRWEREQKTASASATVHVDVGA